MRSQTVVSTLPATGPALAHADGISGVVTGVVETPWTGSETRDATRHCGASSSAHAGLHGRGGSAWMGAGLLITQRSRVQIPPPLPRPEALSRTEKGPFCLWFVHGFVHGRPLKQRLRPPRRYHLVNQAVRLGNLGPVSADLVGVLELVPVTRHDDLQDQHRLARGIPSGHVHRQHRCRLTDAQEL